MGSQHIKGSERLLKSEQQFFCHVFWSLWQEISSKSFILLVSEILELFVNISTPDDKYYLSVKRSVQSTQVKWNYLKIKNIFWSFFSIYGIYIGFELLQKKRWASQAISFWNYRLEKVRFLKCLKSLVSEHLWTVNMLKGPKYYLILYGSIFVIFFDNSEMKAARNILF